jgi:hypothetical protein
MNDSTTSNASQTSSELKTLIRDILQEYAQVEKEIQEPTYKAELVEERRKREQLERRLTELEGESQKNRKIAEQAQLHSAVRAELQKHGIAKIDLAFKAIKDDIRMTDEGEIAGQHGKNVIPLNEYITQFVQSNPELLPARISGGAGTAAPGRSGLSQVGNPVDLDRIRPGMDARDLDRIREEVARVALQALSGR